MPNKPSTPTNPEEIPNVHWADHVAEDLIAKHPGKQAFVCASGISPSGVVHIGNFREAITTDFVVRALRERGKQVRFLYSWDDYDALRKVPANLPNPASIEPHLRKAISRVPDPFGEQASYAGNFEKRFEKEIRELGVEPDYIYQHEPYERGDYRQGIREALENRDLIRGILDRSRTEPLPPDWLPVSIFCKKCLRDTVKIQNFAAPSVFAYRCATCKEDFQVDFEKEGGVKLTWRVDWPMRWAKEGVDFEPGGKDHSSQGGSYETGCEIVRQVWKREPPHYVQYDFVIAKGVGGKLSSSSGKLLTVSEALEVYEPAIIRWIFASRKPNTDFAIAFDLDVMKTYDDFDRTERIAYGVEDAEEKKHVYEKRIYEFSAIKPVKEFGKPPVQFPFRHLCNILQIYQGDIEKTKAFYSVTSVDEARFEARAKRAWKWIHTYAPEDFRFAVRSAETIPKATLIQPVTELVELLEQPSTAKATEDELANLIFQLMKKNQIEPKLFFQEVYGLLIGKKNGPKLASFLIAIGTEKAAGILKHAL